MSIIKQHLSKKTKHQAVILVMMLVVVIGCIAWDALADGPLTQLFNNRGELITAIRDMGALGPILYMLIQIIQTVVAPIPGNVVGGLGGFLFDWWGILWTTIGASIGAFCVFWLSRKFGRSLIEKFVKKSALEKFDFVIGRRAALILFLIFLIPGLPDDIVCYVAGLTEVPLKKLLVIFVIGRLPAVVANNYLGMGLSAGNLTLVVVLSVAGALMLAIIYWQQQNIMALLGATSPKESIEKLKQLREREIIRPDKKPTARKEKKS